MKRTQVDLLKNAVIAEMANSHEGDLHYALDLVDTLAAHGCKLVKFQKFTADEIANESNAPVYQEFSRLSFAEHEFSRLIERAENRGLKVLLDIFGESGLDFAIRTNVAGVKIHASDFLNRKFVHNVLERWSGPLIVSVSGARLSEVYGLMEVANKIGRVDALHLLYGIQSYPTVLEDQHLNRLKSLIRLFGRPVGISDHIDGDDQMAFIVPLLAYAIGARFIEKHVTLDRSRRMDDDHAALTPPEFGRLLKMVEATVMACGTGKLTLSQKDLGYRKKSYKVPVLCNDLAAGSEVHERDVTYKRVNENSTGCIEYGTWLGPVTLARDVRAGEILTYAKVVPRLLGCVIVRVESSRFPRKCLERIQGFTALEFLLRRLRHSRALHQVVVCTTTEAADDSVVEIATRLSVPAFRGPVLDIHDRIVGYIATLHQAPLYIARLTADNVLIDPHMLDEAFYFMIQEGSDYLKSWDLIDGCDFELIKHSAFAKLPLCYENYPENSEYMAAFLNNPELFHISDWHYSQNKSFDQRRYRLTLDYPEDLEVINDVIEHTSADCSYKQICEYMSLKQVLANQQLIEVPAKKSLPPQYRIVQ